ncbi:MAG: RecQ family ATP-dependent DNA helicase [Paludibacteraceae bacterium]|nr:RecQ family ATP-dependent DNA helicase [Paludibacteraceae bacterium]
MGDIYHDILKKYWGYDEFRPLQLDIIKSIADGRDTLGLMPTGGGKSLTFQVPTMSMEGICIVVTPLIALMKDQVDNLRKRRIKAAAVHSGMSFSEINTTLDNAHFGGYKFLYVSPERLGTESFISRLRDMQVCLLVVDESHCISQWGYDFRPSYLRIAEIRAYIPDAPVLALTATATPDVAKDIQDKLLFREYNVLQKSFRRDNLAYVVRQTENKVAAVEHILNKIDGSSVVYVRNRKRTKETAEYLNSIGIKAEYYHAGLSSSERTERQQRWMSGQARVMVATNAFGMGIDKPDVRTVIHIDLPDNIESYFQEAGRAGRDGEKAYAVLLYNPGVDQPILSRRVTDTYPKKDFIRDVYDKLCYYFQIAEHSGLNHMYLFDLESFCTIYKLSFIHTHNALQILQQAGYIELNEDVETNSQILFLTDRNDLYNLQTNEQQDQIINALLRSYTGIFSEPAGINEELIAKHCGLTRRQVVDNLVILAHQHIIRYIPRRRANYVYFLHNRVDSRLLQLDKDVYDRRRERYETRINDMIEYASQKRFCRSQLLLHYFGQTEQQPCMQCDICLSRKEKATAQNGAEQIASEIINILKQEPCNIKQIITQIDADEKTVIDILRTLLDRSLITQDKMMRYCLAQHEK